MLRAILFDLDNTLVLFDEDRFYRGYFLRIEKLFADIMPADQFIERLISATRSMAQNNGAITNAEYFMGAFAQGFEDRKIELWHRFLSFYETEYDKLDAHYTLPDDLHNTMETIARSGLKRVLASNPIFPLNIQLKRLAWAGLGHLPFDMVTHIENMSFCKPRTGYYIEICEKIGEPPESCLMVGNDPVNDMIAAHTGMKTYLTDDSKGTGRVKVDNSGLLRKLKLRDFPAPDFKGPLSKLPETISNFTKS